MENPKSLPDYEKRYWMAYPSVHEELNTAGYTEAFWRGFIRLGFAILGIESAAVVIYLFLTPGSPHRGALEAIAFGALATAAGGILLAAPVARRSWRMTFNFVVTLGSGLALTVCAILDHGIDSPLTYMVILPVISSALVLSAGRVTICATGAFAEVFLITVLDPGIATEDAVVVTIFALVVGVAILAVVYSKGRIKLEEHEERVLDRLAEIAETDTLTGCLNHGAFYGRLESEIDRFDRYGEMISFLMVDVDLFKSYNDAHGHLAGDRALAEIGSALRAGARRSDIVGRVGGDEFALILPHTPTYVAEQVAERLSDAIRKRNDIGITVSIGVASIDRTEPTMKRLIRDADTSLYEAKAEGRARVVAAPHGAEVRLETVQDATDMVSEDRELLEERVRQIGRANAETLALMDSMFEVAPMGLRFVDRELRTLRVNELSARVCGIPVQDQIGRPVTEVLPPSLLQQVEPVYRRVLETGQSVTFEAVVIDRAIDPDGVRHWHSTYYPIRLGQEVTGVGVVGVDVTDRHELMSAQHRLIHSMVTALASVVEMRDPYTSGHPESASLIATAIAAELGLDQPMIDVIELAAQIHDLGKIRVPTEILARPSRLTDAEMAMVREHSQLGADILEAGEFPESIRRIVLQHHERLDGSGYPAGLRGAEIDLGAKVVAVADVIDAMAAPRPYRPALGIEAALSAILEGRGSLFDEEVVDACVKLYRTGRLGATEATSSDSSREYSRSVDR